MIRRIISLMLCLIMIVTSMSLVVSAAVPNIEAPKNLKVEVKKEDNGYPYFLVSFDVPASVMTLYEQAPENEADMFYEIEFKVGNGEWEMAGAAHFTTGFTAELYPQDLGLNEDVDIRANVYYFRARFYYYSTAGYDEYGNRIAAEPVVSHFSNIASTAIEEFKYENASTWAVPELDKAAQYGFITDKIRSQMNAPITREELAEVIMKMYEKIFGEASYSDTSAFSDTKNPEIYKAYELGIVSGVGNGRFAPKDLTNREQVAAMLHRAVKVINPDADFSIEGAPKFTDENLISGWALESVKFMSKNGLILGSNGYVNPKGTTTREQAVLIIVRTYEKYHQ